MAGTHGSNLRLGCEPSDIPRARKRSTDLASTRASLGTPATLPMR
jgi:hypothetical protein